MPDLPRRRFTLIDAMVLIAATAVGFAGWRLSWIIDQNDPLRPQMFISESAKYLHFAPRMIRASESCLMAWSLALSVLRLRRPRPSPRRLVLQPGAVVGFVAAMVLTIGLLHLLALAVVARVYGGVELWEDWGLEALNVGLNPPHRRWHLISLWAVEGSPYIASGVLSAWLVLALGRRCRPEPSWIDRTGRGLGGLWLLAATSRMWSEVVETVRIGTHFAM